jgi:hypothetical protein
MYDKSKVKTGDCVVCFSHGELLSDLEIWVQKAECVRLGLPFDTKIATHIANIVVIKEPTIIEKKKWFWRSEKHVLNPDVYVFEEKAGGMEFGLLTDRYSQDAVITIKTHVNPYGEVGEESFRYSCLNQWKNSRAYGFFNFIVQPLHTALGWFSRTPTLLGSMICSQSYAANCNNVCRDLGRELEFPTEGTVNPFEIDQAKFLIPVV